MSLLYCSGFCYSWDPSPLWNGARKMCIQILAQWIGYCQEITESFEDLNILDTILLLPNVKEGLFLARDWKQGCKRKSAGEQVPALRFKSKQQTYQVTVLKQGSLCFVLCQEWTEKLLLTQKTESWNPNNIPFYFLILAWHANPKLNEAYTQLSHWAKLELQKQNICQTCGK